jgi:hypothetical protein
MMGIRLAKEDELEGLDLTGITLPFYHLLKNEVSICIAHGESWEVNASRVVNDSVKQSLEEQGTNREKVEDTCSFELHFTPTNSSHKSITIPLSTRQTSVDCESEAQFWKQ